MDHTIIRISGFVILGLLLLGAIAVVYVVERHVVTDKYRQHFFYVGNFVPILRDQSCPEVVKRAYWIVFWSWIIWSASLLGLMGFLGQHVR
jgi:hypothetical protein